MNNWKRVDEWYLLVIWHICSHFSVCFFKYEAIAIGVNSKEVHDTKSSEMSNNPLHRMITSQLDIS